MFFLKNLAINKLTGNIYLFVVLFSIFSISPDSIYAQFYSLGSDPSWVKWRTIHTKNFRIIYPKEIDSLAQRYAHLMESANDWVQSPLKIKANPIDVVLHPYNVNSNGLVVWAPKRMEFITKPPALRGYSQNWEKQLVVHEIRHLAQISKYEHGIFKPLSWVIGQQAQGLGVGLYIDKWALEGDAVVSETEFSYTGRGRDPEHLIFFKAVFLDGEYRSWMEWKLGSGKKYCPDAYSLGYLVHSYIRYSSGNSYYMGDLSEYLIKHFYNPSASRRAYAKTTGKILSGHFDSIKKVLGAKWANEDSLKAPFTPFSRISKRVDDYSSLKNIVAVSPNSLYGIKWDMDEPSRLVLMDSSGGEKHISYVGNMSSYLKYGKGRLYWTEQVSSLRWEQESFSELKCYDIKKDKIYTLSQKNSYSNPSLSQSGDTIAVSDYSTGEATCLVLLKTKDYKPFASYLAPQKGQIKESVFLGDKIYATVITEKGMGLFRLDLISGMWSKEIEEQSKSMTGLCSYMGAIYFESDLNGTDNIYCYSPEIKFLQRLTNARFGGFSPFLDGVNGLLYYSEYEKNGYFAVKARLDNLLWKPETFTKPFRDPMADIMSKQAGYSIDTVDVTGEKKYESKPYLKTTHLFRFHSWAPFYYNIDKIKSMSYESVYDIISPGATVYSQNTLSTAETMLAYSYKNGFHAGHLDFTYSGIYPVINIKTDYNDRYKREIRLIRDNQNRRFQIVAPVTGSPYFSTIVFVYVPLNLSSGGWYRGFIPKLLWKFSNDSYYSVVSGKYRNYQYFSYGLQYYSILGSSTRGLFPKLGLGLSWQMNTIPFSEENFGSLIYTNIYGYLPGLMPNHGIRLSLTYQMQNYKGKNYLFSNIATSPRGYEQQYGKQFLSLSADYAFPIYLGDIQLTVLLYLKRLQVIPFVDWAYNQGALEDKKMFSVGSDFLLDFNFLNIPVPVSVGFRYARTMDNRNLTQFLFKLPI